MLIESLIFECQLQNKIEATSVLKLALLKLRSKFKASKQSSPKHQNNCQEIEKKKEIKNKIVFCVLEAYLSPKVDSQLNIYL